jgi:subtilisin family serine protease
MRKMPMVSLLVALFIALVSGKPVTTIRAEATHFRPGGVLVKFKEGASVADMQAVLTRRGLTIQREIPPLGIKSLAVPLGQELVIAESMRRDPSVEYAEPDCLASATTIPDDPSWDNQWAPAKIGAPAAWEMTTGSADIIIAVLDTGVKLDHPDLAAKIWTNLGEIPANGLDDDQNGKIDDIHGWHFYHHCSNSNCFSCEDDDLTDDNGHGTHVAGIAAAETDNGTGIAGISWGAQLMPIKVLDEYGDGWYSDVIVGIVYATDNGADIINLSLGGEESSQALQDAVNYGHANGVLLVAATGNSGGSVLYPAACDHVLAVGATDVNDLRPGFSNHGPEIDIAAPGVAIYSTWPRLDGYWSKSGTSMAAPHVAGLAALIWSVRPDATNDYVTWVIIQTAVDPGAPGWDEFYGWGRIDAYQALLSASRFKLYVPFLSPLY